jgi:hypothetical protein
MSIEKSSDLNGNRTRDLPACSIVPQPTAVQRSVRLNHEQGLLGWTKLQVWTADLPPPLSVMTWLSLGSVLT